MIEGVAVPTSEAGAKHVSELLIREHESRAQLLRREEGMVRRSRYAAVVHIGELLMPSMHKIHVETNAANILTCDETCKRDPENKDLLAVFAGQQVVLPSTADMAALRLDHRVAIFHQNPGVSKAD